MKIIINQRFGCGDLIFIMSIIRGFIADGHEIIIPVFPHFVDQFRRAYPEITWVDYNTIPIDYNKQYEHDWNGYKVLPIAWANEMLGREYKHVMRSKYDLFNLDYTKWKENAMWKRDKKREEKVFYELHADQLPGYTVVSRYFGSNAQYKANIPAAGIEINPKRGYDLFDYAFLLEKAKYIFAANSSILYLLELLDLKAKEIHLYSRKPIEPDHRNTEYLFTKPYILHT